MLKPQSDWILTKVVEVEPRHVGLIFVVSDKKDATKYVKIVSFGPDANKGKELNVGDIVLVPTVSGIKTVHEDVEYEMAKENNFLGVYEKKED
jgi:co-chaperonin GroES (HSP10)